MVIDEEVRPAWVVAGVLMAAARTSSVQEIEAVGSAALPR